MSSQMSYGSGSSMLFQSMNDDLNASLATADELSREFSSLLQEASASPTTQPASQNISLVPREMPTPMVRSRTSSPASSPSTVTTSAGGGSRSSSPIISTPFSPSSTSPRPLNNVISGAKNRPSSPVHRQAAPGPPRSPADHFSYSQKVSPNQSPRIQRRSVSPSRYNRSPRGSVTHLDPGPLVSPPRQRSPQPGRRSRGSLPHMDPPGALASPTLQVPYDGTGHSGRRSPQPDRSSSPRPYSHPVVSSTLPRNFGAFKQADDSMSMQRQKSSGKWNETDLDASYERKAHHTYNKTDWLRPSVPNSNWKESNLDGPPPGPSPKKDTLSRPQQQQPSHHASLPRNARISVPPDMSPSPAHSSPYHPQPIISRISIPPPASVQPPRQRKPIPLSVIMRLQNPTWVPYAYHPRAMMMGMEDVGPYQGAMPMPMPMPVPREFFHQPMHPPPSQPLHPHEMMQPAYYNEVLNPGDVDAEIERLDLIPMPPEMPRGVSASDRAEGGGGERAVLAPAAPPPRPLSPTRLQPVMAPVEAQSQEADLPDLEELLRVRAEIPRALKRRGSVQGGPASQTDPAPLKKASHYEPNQYKHLINKLFRRKGHGSHRRREPGQENSSSSSEGEESPALPPPALPPAPLTSTPVLQDHRGYHSILRRASREHRGTGRRARLSPLVLLLDGSLVGELDTVKRAVQEMSDPSQPNDEGITALHNAICGGHYNVVDFLVRIGANVSTPDSHGWTPLHCAASCNDRILCEFLVRNGAAVMAMTESDGATASQKCDPYAVGYEECVSFLRGVEEAMGVENSGVLYALWSYPAQAPDELSFKEGDMVTILQKPEGVHWWWASLCGREGFVPNNYFGLFPKVRPKSLC